MLSRKNVYFITNIDQTDVHNLKKKEEKMLHMSQPPVLSAFPNVPKNSLRLFEFQIKKNTAQFRIAQWKRVFYKSFTARDFFCTMVTKCSHGW